MTPEQRLLALCLEEIRMAEVPREPTEEAPE